MSTNPIPGWAGIIPPSKELGDWRPAEDFVGSFLNVIPTPNVTETALGEFSHAFTCTNGAIANLTFSLSSFVKTTGKLYVHGVEFSRWFLFSSRMHKSTIARMARRLPESTLKKWELLQPPLK